MSRTLELLAAEGAADVGRLEQAFVAEELSIDGIGSGSRVSIGTYNIKG